MFSSAETVHGGGRAAPYKGGLLVFFANLILGIHRLRVDTADGSKRAFVLFLARGLGLGLETYESYGDIFRI